MADAEPPAANARPKAVLFDWDNTLVDTWPILHDATNFTLEAFGLEPWTLDETKTRVRKSLRDSFPELFGDRWEEAGDVFYRRYEAIHADQVAALPGAADALEALSAAGIYLAVISNKRGDLLRAEAERLGWRRHFGNLVGANDADNDKPAPDVVAAALKGSGVGPGPAVWIAGDADIDLECASRARCVPVLVREAAPGAGEFASHPPARYFAGCQTLCKFIINL